MSPLKGNAWRITTGLFWAVGLLAMMPLGALGAPSTFAGPATQIVIAMLLAAATAVGSKWKPWFLEIGLAASLGAAAMSGDWLWDDLDFLRWSLGAALVATAYFFQSGLQRMEHAARGTGRGPSNQAAGLLLRRIGVATAIAFLATAAPFVVLQLTAPLVSARWARSLDGRSEAFFACIAVIYLLLATAWVFLPRGDERDLTLPAVEP